MLLIRGFTGCKYGSGSLLSRAADEYGIVSIGGKRIFLRDPSLVINVIN